MTNQILQNTVLQVLRNPGIQNINYDLNGLTVASMCYGMVAYFVSTGQISCEAVDKMPVTRGQEPPPGSKIEAVYNPDKDTMYFPRENYGKSNGFERSVILHEATHAAFDVFAKSKDDRVLGIDDESAAVLAQALYFRLCEPNESQAIHRFSMLIDGPGELGLKIADNMIASADFKARRLQKLKPDQLVKFRDAVAKQWDLVRIDYPDGTWRDRSGALSIYNGVVVCAACQGQTRK